MTIEGQRRRLHILGSGVTASKVWGDTDFLRKFVPTATANPSTIAVSVTRNVKDHRRSAYPGDPGYAVKGGVRKALNRVPSKGGGSLPGRSFRMALLKADGSPDPENTHQFSYQGSFANLWANIDAGSTVRMILYSPSNRPHPLNTPAV
jgi:hypothetical protein